MKETLVPAWLARRMVLGSVLGSLVAGAGLLLLRADLFGDVLANRCYLFFVSLAVLAAALGVYRLIVAAAAAGILLWVGLRGGLPPAAGTSLLIAIFPVVALTLVRRRPRPGEPPGWPAFGGYREFVFYGCFLAWVAVLLTAVWFVPYAMAHAAANRMADESRFAILKGGTFRVGGEGDNSATPADLALLRRDWDQLRAALWGEDGGEGMRPLLERHGLLPYTEAVQEELAARGWARQPPSVDKTISFFANDQTEKESAERAKSELLNWVEDQRKTDQPQWPVGTAWLDAFERLVRSIDVKEYPVSPEIDKLGKAVDSLRRQMQDNPEAVNSPLIGQGWVQVRDLLPPAIGAAKEYHVQPLEAILLKLKDAIIEARALSHQSAEFHASHLQPLVPVVEASGLVPAALPPGAAERVRFALKQVADAIKRDRPGSPKIPTIPPEIVELTKAVEALQAFAAKSPDQAGSCAPPCLEAWARVEKALRPALGAADADHAGGVIGDLDRLRLAVDKYSELTRPNARFKDLDEQRLTAVEKILLAADVVPASLEARARDGLREACDAVVKAIQLNRTLPVTFHGWNADELLARVAHSIQLEEVWKDEMVTWEGRQVEVYHEVWERWNKRFRGSSPEVNPAVIDEKGAIQRALAEAAPIIKQVCLQEAELWRTKKRNVEKAAASGPRRNPRVPRYPRDVCQREVRALLAEDFFWGKPENMKKLKETLAKLNYMRVGRLDTRWNANPADVDAAVEDVLDMVETYAKKMEKVGGDDAVSSKTLHDAASWYNIFNANDVPGKKRRPIETLLDMTEQGVKPTQGKGDDKPVVLEQLGRDYLDALRNSNLPHPKYEPDLYKQWEERKRGHGSSGGGGT